MAAPVEARILGPIELISPDGDQLRPRSSHQRSLLACLLLARGASVSTGRLFDALWPDTGPADPAKTLQFYVSELRRLLDADPEQARGLLRYEAGGYRLALPVGSVDLLRFEHHLGDAQRLRVDGSATEALEAVERALTEWRGTPLGGSPEPRPFLADIAELEARHRQAVELRCEIRLDQGDHVSLLPELERLVIEHPMSERLHVFRMVALYRAGRQPDALNAYSEARQALVEGAGLEPGRELRRTQFAILHGEPALSPTTQDQEQMTPARSRRKPFVGRAEELKHLVDALADSDTSTRFVLVNGEAGVGKSRLLSEFASRAEEAGAVVAWGRCGQAPLPRLAPLVRAIDDALARYPGGARALEHIDRGALADLWPELSPTDDAFDPDSEEAPYRRRRAIAGLLRAMAKQRPLVLLFDDVHWIDAETSSTLGAVLEAIDEPNLLVVGWLHDLGEATSKAVEAAAILGQEFNGPDLARMLSISNAELDRHLDEASASGLVEPCGKRSWRFVHDLVRETIYSGLPDAERARLHGWAADASKHPTSPSANNVLVLAHHLQQSLDYSDAQRTAKASMAAGDLTRGLFAYPNAAGHYGDALAALSGVEHSSRRDATETELLLALGEMRMRAGDTAPAQEALGEALDLARVRGDNASTAQAINLLTRRRSPHGLIDEPEMVALLEEGLAACRGTDTELEIRLLDNVAAALSLTDQRASSEELARDALAISDRLGAPGPRAVALTGAHTVMWYPDNPKQRLEMADEAITCARRRAQRTRLPLAGGDVAHRRHNCIRRVLASRAQHRRRSGPVGRFATTGRHRCTCHTDNLSSFPRSRRTRGRAGGRLHRGPPRIAAVAMQLRLRAR